MVGGLAQPVHRSLLESTAPRILSNLQSTVQDRKIKSRRNGLSLGVI